MNKQSENGIEWTNYTWNPIKGLCPMNCWYCYARKMYKRFKWNPAIRLDARELMKPLKLKNPSKIFVGSMIELFHNEIFNEWRIKILEVINHCPQHTFQILTKCPENAIGYIFPKNVWLGTSVSANTIVGSLRIGDLSDCQCGIKFVSFEPLLSPVNELIYNFIDWIIVGGLTPQNKHEKEWIDEIVERANENHIPVFIKHNAHYPIKKQQFPRGGF